MGCRRDLLGFPCSAAAITWPFSLANSARLFQLQRYCNFVYYVLWFSHFWVKQEQKRDKWAAERVPWANDFCFVLTKQTVNCPWNVLKQPWNSTLLSPYSFLSTNSNGQKKKLFVSFVVWRAIFFFFGASVKVCMPDGMRKARPDFRTAEALLFSPSNGRRGPTQLGVHRWRTGWPKYTPCCHSIQAHSRLFLLRPLWLTFLWGDLLQCWDSWRVTKWARRIG